MSRIFPYRARRDPRRIFHLYRLSCSCLSPERVPLAHLTMGDITAKSANTLVLNGHQGVPDGFPVDGTGEMAKYVLP